MLRILIIIFLAFLLFRFLGSILKSLGAGSSNDSRNRNGRYSRPRDGNVNVDNQSGNKKRKKDFRGGEYVDFEEVK